ncbi:MAG TPA: DUF58 domain-containing protein [Gemmatimonadaceae bacterium]
MNLSEVLSQVQRLEIRSRHLVKDVLAGEYSSVFKGRGVEFEDVRPYLPGDDVRSIDWRVTARTGAPYVRRYVEERERTVLFVVDHSASGAFGTRRQTKVELATEVCAALLLAAVRNHDRVGALLFTNRVERYFAPAKGKRHAMRVIRELVAFQPEGRGTDLAGALQFTDRVLRRHAVIFILSDWLAAGFERPLEMVARRHDAIAVQLVDVRERELPDAGLMVLRDPESGAWRYVDTSRASVRTTLEQQVRVRDEMLVQTLRRRGVDLIRLRTGENYAGPLMAFFRMRERMLRR